MGVYVFAYVVVSVCVLGSLPRVLCWEGHGPFLLCAGVMVGPLHLHTFACRQTELLLTASRADCLPGPRPNPVGMVTRDGEKTWRGRLAARPASLDKSLSETSLQWTDVNSNDLQMSLSEGQQKEVACKCVGLQQCRETKSPFHHGKTHEDYVNCTNYGKQRAHRVII